MLLSLSSFFPFVSQWLEQIDGKFIFEFEVVINENVVDSSSSQ